jgi:hypothetical protein
MQPHACARLCLSVSWNVFRAAGEVFRRTSTVSRDDKNRTSRFQLIAVDFSLFQYGQQERVPLDFFQYGKAHYKSPNSRIFQIREAVHQNKGLTAVLDAAKARYTLSKSRSFFKKDY